MAFTTYPLYPDEIYKHHPTIHDWDAWLKDPVRYPVNRRYGTVQGHSGYWPILPPVAPSMHIWKDGVLHYTGADDLIDGDPGESYDRLDDYLNAIHVSYVNGRGYSIGYNWAVDYLGGIWKLRGWDIINAANAGCNDFSFSILCLVDGQDSTNYLMDMSIRWLMWQGELRAGKMLSQRGHREVGNTLCPGSGIMSKMHNGMYSPRWYVPNPNPNPSLPPGSTHPPITNITEDNMQLIRITDDDQALDPALFLVTGSFVEWVWDQGRANSLSFMRVLDHAGSQGQVPPTPYDVDRGFLQYYTLIGAAPNYPLSYTGPKTSPGDFTRWVA